MRSLIKFSFKKSNSLDYFDGEELSDENEVKEVKPKSPLSIFNLNQLKKLFFIGRFEFILSIIVLIICFRLYFSAGGIADYLKMKSLIESQNKKLAFLEVKNKRMKTVIEKIKSDRNFQYKLVRKHLDVYSQDEFVVFFTEDF